MTREATGTTGISLGGRQYDSAPIGNQSYPEYGISASDKWVLQDSCSSEQRQLDAIRDLW